MVGAGGSAMLSGVHNFRTLQSSGSCGWWEVGAADLKRGEAEKRAAGRGTGSISPSWETDISPGSQRASANTLHLCLCKGGCHLADCLWSNMLLVYVLRSSSSRLGWRETPCANWACGGFVRRETRVACQRVPVAVHQSELDGSPFEIPSSLNFHWHSYCFLQMFWCWHDVLLKNSCPAQLTIPSFSKLSALFDLPGLWQSHHKETCNLIQWYMCLPEDTYDGNPSYWLLLDHWELKAGKEIILRVSL